MRLYVTAFAVAIVSTPVLVASTPINHPWHDIVTPQSLSSWSEPNAGQDLPVDSSEDEFSLDDYIHTGSDYYLSHVDKSKTTDVGVYHQSIPPKPIGQNDKLPTVPLPGFYRSSEVSMTALPPDDLTSYALPPLTTPQDMPNNTLVTHIGSRFLPNTTSTSERIEDSGSLHISSVMGHGSDFDGQHTTPEKQSTDEGHRVVIRTCKQKPHGKQKKKYYCDGRADWTAESLANYCQESVEKYLGFLAISNPEKINIVSYFFAASPKKIYSDEQQAPKNLICFTFWSMREQKFACHCEQIDTANPYPVGVYVQLFVARLPVLITYRFCRSDDIQELTSRLNKQFKDLSPKLKSVNQAGLNHLTGIFFQAYPELTQDATETALAPNMQIPVTSQYVNDLFTELNNVATSGFRDHKKFQFITQ